ncbi:MAG: acyltransferase [Erythrobacter sp.]|jgi:peptidoglycan/LPS O-acetylase OafA/YrhL
MHQDRRFATIDALRGLAAIGVMLFHVRQDVSLRLPGGYLAVDLFFGLSGFVIAQAYGHRLAQGMTPREFLERRAIRLWPMLALGAMLGILLHGGHAGMLFLLPNWVSPRLLYPANPPLWSLLFEMVAYAGFALLLHRLGTRALLMIATASGLALAAYAATPMRFADLGADWASFAAGLARVGYSFTAGVLAWRLGMQGTRTSGLAWLLALPLIAAFLIIGEDDNLAALLAVLVGVPLMVVAASRVEVTGRGLAALLGDASYPLYCIHVPLLALLAGASELAIFGTCAALIVLSAALERRFDRPVRRWLENRRRRAQARRQTRIGIST